MLTTVPVIDLTPLDDGSPAGRRMLARECLPGCWDPARYEPVTSGQHRLTKFLRGVGAGAPAPRV
jgi:hypothetical protein